MADNDKANDMDEEKLSLKASPGISRYGSSDINTPLLSDHNHTDHTNAKASPGGGSLENQASVPSLTRRMSSQFVFQVERQRSVADNIGLTERINQVVPDAITQHIPGLQRRASELKLTYFCNICFTKYPIEDGFSLRTCQHQFCADCLRGFMTSKIGNGQINMTCFYPVDATKACKEKIDEEDIHQIVDAETWEKYERFKANLDSSYSRQCPFCEQTQNGDPAQPMMRCENDACGKMYCLYHSNAHDESMSCEEYELTIAKETKMSEMAIEEMGDNVKPCPKCKFRIIKNGGCNHMNCVKCGCSFCWLCMNEIEDDELPLHYKDPNSPCKGQQFAGMEGEATPKWLLCVIVMCMILFCIPSTALAVVFGLLCFPFVVICDCKNDTGERQTLMQTMFGCWMLWLIVFIVIASCIPVIIAWAIGSLIKAVYDILRICCPCLPERCCARNNDDANVDDANGNNRARNGQQNGGNAYVAVEEVGNRESLLSGVENNNNADIAIKED